MLKKSIFAAAVFALAATAASAESLKPVRDFRGNFAKDFRGNCLRTKWVSDTDECGYEEKPVQPPMIQAQISYIDLVRQSIYFDIDKYNIDAEDVSRMNQVIDEVNKSHGVQSVRFVGYADQFATYQYNQKLSNRRAEQIANYFKSQNYFTAGNVQTSYFGDTRPVTSCNPKLPKSQLIACRATDRRVDIEVELIRQKTETVAPNDPRITAKYTQQVTVPTERLQVTTLQQPQSPVVAGAPVFASQQAEVSALQPVYAAPAPAPQAAPVVDAQGRLLPKSMQPGYSNAAGATTQQVITTKEKAHVPAKTKKTVVKSVPVKTAPVATESLAPANEVLTSPQPQVDAASVANSVAPVTAPAVVPGTYTSNAVNAAQPVPPLAGQPATGEEVKR